MKTVLNKILSLALAAVCIGGLCGCDIGSEKKYTEYYLDYFDTATTVIGYADSEEEFSSVSELVEEMLDKYHKLYDIYNSYDGITNLADINSVEDGVHKAHNVTQEIMELLSYAKDMYTLTGGEVNVAMGSVLSLWHKARTAAMSNPDEAGTPDARLLAEAAEHTDIDDVILDKENMTVFLADPEMTLDVGAIAKGYAVERIAEELQRRGFTGYILNVGGNIRTVGAKPDGSPWTAGITDPDAPESENYREYVSLSDCALVTSGSYQRFYRIGDTAFHHIIDKDTLYPSVYFDSVSVLCADSALADSLSTALFNMSYAEGSALIESVAGAEAMWIDKEGEILYSSGFKGHTYAG